MRDPREEAGVARVALVTGGSRGIGAATVRRLWRRGLSVAFTYQSQASAAQALVAELSSGSSGRAVRAYPHDLRAGQPDCLVDDVVRQMGGLDTLVLNAGAWSGGPLAARDDEEWWTVVETNLRGSARLAKASIAPLASSSAGSVVFVSSVVGLVGFAGDTAYAASKAAMVGLARSLAKELGRAGTRVNVLAPGFAATDMTDAVSPAQRDRIMGRTALRRFATADEVAAGIEFLAEDATYATGTVLTIDGGWSL